jgi:restriction endonuclease S subunit
MAWTTKKLRELVEDLEEERIFILDPNKEYSEPTLSSKDNKLYPRRTMMGSNFKVKKRILIKPGDLVIERLHTQRGMFAYSDRIYAATSTFLPFKVREDIVDKEFLFYALKVCIKNLSKVDTTGRENYSKKEILEIEIPYPPLHIQRKIVKKLKMIEKAQKLADELKLGLQKLFENYLNEVMQKKISK